MNKPFIAQLICKYAKNVLKNIKNLMFFGINEKTVSYIPINDFEVFDRSIKR